MKVYRIENGEKIEEKDNELVKAYNAYLDKIAALPKEERLKYFRSMCIPPDLDFAMDFGETIIIARTHFSNSSSETVMQTTERIAQKEI